MALRKAVCAFCKKAILKETGEISRAKKKNAPIHCNRTCAGLGRRKNKSKEQKVKEKRLYDQQYRNTNKLLLKTKKSAYHKRTYDPAKAAAERKLKMPRHVEYCRRPEYRKWKVEYDRKFRANRVYGEFSESFLLLQDIENEVSSRISRYEIYQQNGILNKRQQRKRQYENLIRA